MHTGTGTERCETADVLIVTDTVPPAGVEQGDLLQGRGLDLLLRGPRGLPGRPVVRAGLCGGPELSVWGLTGSTVLALLVGESVFVRVMFLSNRSKTSKFVKFVAPDIFKSLAPGILKKIVVPEKYQQCIGESP